MKFQLKSNWLSLRSKYQIKDEYGDIAFTVKGKFLSFGHDLTIENRKDVPVAKIEQRLFKLMPTFDLILGGKKYATISKQFSWFKKRFLLDVPGPNDYDIEGSFWDYEYEFRRHSQVVATVSRTFFSLPSVYGVDMLDSEDPVSILATVVVIDLCNNSDSAVGSGAITA